MSVRTIIIHYSSPLCFNVCRKCGKKVSDETTNSKPINDLRHKYHNKSALTLVYRAHTCSTLPADVLLC